VFETGGGANIVFKNGRIGNVVDEKGALVGGNVDPTPLNNTFDNVVFHDIRVQNSTTHNEAMYIMAPGTVVKNSTFCAPASDCGNTGAILTQRGSWWGQQPWNGLRFLNNQFGRMMFDHGSILFGNHCGDVVTWVVDKASLGTNQGAGGTATTITLTTTNAVASGAWIFVGVSHFNASATFSSLSNTGAAVTWTNVQLANNGGVRSALIKGDASSGLASGSVITATFSATTNERRICASSFTGGTGVTNNQATTTGATTAWSVSPTILGTDLVVASASLDTLSSSTPDANSTELQDFIHTGTSTAILYYRIGGTGVGGTWANAANWAAAGGSFADSAGGATSTVVHPTRMPLGV
jgi:hypothetical protein